MLDRLSHAYLCLLMATALVVAVFVAYAVVARWWLHGSVTARSLSDAVVDTADRGARGQRCVPAASARTWTCDVTGPLQSERIVYRVTVDRDSSCWHARATAGAGYAPPALSGCVHRWQWSLL